eukprot:CAMPEP_0178438128 /NCGR_PEP_ID=MMETSP0689_2-20121128/35400_1 /TAXON_ID=160604 /ORGANISM="Amphidinium massartii, Strain CS-259" /LENGTH=177 /DNA_ID=CAMNT_0020060455 /DNA_START=35 /DNA_END=565 /DNA_ORIENTATION=+
MASIVGHFRLIVPGATAKPSPKIGQALGPLGINMMNFCKEINARTTGVRPEVPLQVTIVPRTDRTYKFILRSPQSKWFLFRSARLPIASGHAVKEIKGAVTLKEIYHIAKAKCMDPNFVGVPLRTICMGLINTCRAMGIHVGKELPYEFRKRDDIPVLALPQMRKEERLRNKATRKP